MCIRDRLGAGHSHAGAGKAPDPCLRHRLRHPGEVDVYKRQDIGFDYIAPNPTGDDLTSFFETDARKNWLDFDGVTFSEEDTEMCIRDRSEGTTKVSDVFATDDVNRFTITKAAAPTNIQSGTPVSYTHLRRSSWIARQSLPPKRSTAPPQ